MESEPTPLKRLKPVAAETLECRRHFSVASVASVSVAESADAAVFHVTLDTPSDATISLKYSLVPMTAARRQDFQPVAGRLQLLPGETSADISVPLVHDDIDEDDETFGLRLRGPAAAAPAQRGAPSAVATIGDDDEPPLVFIDDVFAYYRNRHARLTVRLGNPVGQDNGVFGVYHATIASGRAITIRFYTLDGLPSTETPNPSDIVGVAGVNYEAASGTITFRPGRTHAYVRVNVLFPKGPVRRFRVHLSEAINANLAGGDDEGNVLIANTPVYEPPGWFF
jgi:hypothetical protein